MVVIPSEWDFNEMKKWFQLQLYTKPFLIIFTNSRNRILLEQ